MSFKVVIKAPAKLYLDTKITFINLLPERLKSKTLQKNQAKLSPIFESELKRQGFKPKKGGIFSFQDKQSLHILYFLDQPQTPKFSRLEKSREIYNLCERFKSKNILVDLRDTQSMETDYLDSLASAFHSGQFQMPSFKSQKASKKLSQKLNFLVPKDTYEACKKQLVKSIALSEAGNEIRHLIALPANKLKPSDFHDYVRKKATEDGLKFQFHSFSKLQKMGAGAFCAVAQANPKSGAGIAQITYESNKKSDKHLILVGKGITFDTGGINLKPGISMLGMKGDMGGAATAHSFLGIAKKLKWNLKITVLLAISDNKVSETAYQPDEVVTSLSGKTIEVIHTDAEGRMALADTLHLASQLKPDLIIDFATLTGASVRAIGRSFSSVYTNQEKFNETLIAAGKASGERVWPFPMDEDYKRILESEVADIKQCAPSGGCDHIEAAIFLKEFVGKNIDWVHMDLSSAKSDGPLAHVKTKESGFGPRIITEFLKDQELIF